MWRLNFVLLMCFYWFVVAKRTSVFDDPTKEIQELTALIKQDITALNSAVVDLQFLSNSRNESGNISSDTTSHSTTVVDDLKNRLMSTTKEFKEVLTMRTEVRPVLLSIFAFSVRLVISVGVYFHHCCFIFFVILFRWTLMVFYWFLEELEGSWEQKTAVFFHCF